MAPKPKKNAPGFIQPASAAQNRKNPPKPPPKSGARVTGSVPVPQKGSIGGKPIKRATAKPSMPVKPVGPSTKVSVHYAGSHSAPSGATTSMPSTSGGSSTPSAPMSLDGIYKSMGFSSPFEEVRNTPTSTTNGMTGVDDKYKFKALQAFADFKF